MKKLLIVTGSGSSVEFGMPSVKDIDRLFEEWALQVTPLKADPTKSLYTWTKNVLIEYCSQNRNNRMSVLTGFENILFTMQHIAAMSNDVEWGHFNNRIIPFVNLKELPDIIMFGNERRATGGEFGYLHSVLVDNLLDYFRDLCKQVQLNFSNELRLAGSFFDELKKEFKIGFVNLNYDNVILSAVPGLNTGFDLADGKFKRDLLYNGNWNFCYHLHGSIYFDMIGGKDTEMHKIFWNADLNSRYSQNSSGRSSHQTIEGLLHLTSSIITGLDKPNQLLHEPFSSYFMQLDRVVFESDAILFIGYGFADHYLNALFPFTRYDGKRRKVVIIDWASKDGDALSYRHDDWSYGVFQAIPFNGFEMGDRGFREVRPAGYFKRSNKLERSSNPDYPLAIWYNGFLEACRHPKPIFQELV